MPAKKREPKVLGVLASGDFERQVTQRAAKIRRAPDATRRAFKKAFDRSAAGLSIHGLAIFDLFMAHLSTIGPHLHRILAADPTTQDVCPPDEDGEVPDAEIMTLTLPESGTRWGVVFEFPDTDTVAELDMDGWTALGLFWTH